MLVFPAALQELADQFARLPGIGGKTAQRLAFHVLELPLEDAQEFADAILEAKRTVHTCPECQNLTDREVCPICDDETEHQILKGRMGKATIERFVPQKSCSTSFLLVIRSFFGNDMHGLSDVVILYCLFDLFLFVLEEIVLKSSSH